jgi:signal transduction histidine kinase
LDGAIRVTDDFEGGGETYALQKELYERAGDWKRAYEALQKEKQFDDSVNTVVLSNSMKGMQNEIDLYEAGQKLSKQRMIVLAVVIAFLSIIVVLLLIYSLTHQRYMNTMRIARDQAMESDRMKTAFISNISHEIRTPLNIIGGFMQVLSDPGMQLEMEERNQITEIVLRNTNLITSLVDELIELSLTGAGGEVEQNDSVMPNEIGRMAVAEIDREIPEEVKVGFSSDVNDEYEIKTNRNMLFKVLRALLDNAVKYTEKGHITLTFSKLDSSLRYVIEDTGCGIPPEESERIFARFEKLNDFKDGLGLGLTLARALARHLGGDVTLDTSYTDGARFILELPLP